MEQQRIQLFNRSPVMELAAQEDGIAKMSGFATLYDTETDLGYFTLSIDKKAFKESIEAGDDVVALLNHDLNFVLGRSPKTLSLDWNQKKGLWTETILASHGLGSQVKEQISRGDLNQMSVAFVIQSEEVTREENKAPHVRVTKARLEDISAVTFGQYPDTTLEVSKLSARPVSEDMLRRILERHEEIGDVERDLSQALEIYKLRNANRRRRISKY